MLIEITHTTRFSYEDPIEESTVEAWLSPREDSAQRRYRFSLEVQPNAPTFSYTDGFGNTVHFFNVLPPHRTLAVTARSRVETLLTNPFAPPERAPAEPEAIDLWQFLQFGGPVLRVEGVEALARQFRPADPAGTWDALRALMHEIRETFEYEAEVTTVSSTVEDLFSLRKGVCQDFAHLMIAVCRAMGVPARYASGYIVNRPDREARGAAASHAWCEAWVPGFGWRGFDPTNDLVAADSLIKVGVGRNYHDVPPTRGIYRGASLEQITVSVETVVLGA